MAQPLRVLHAVVNMNRGGAETLLMNLYRNIDKTKIQFDFLTCQKGVFDEEIIAKGGRIHRIPYVTEIGHRRFQSELDRFFKQHPEYMIIHSHLDRMSGLILRAARDHVPIRIAHSHNTRSEGGILAKAYKWYNGRFILPNATHLYACSEAAAHWLFRNRAKNAIILNNGIEADRFIYSESIRVKIRKELGIEDHVTVFGHVGRFAKQKNHEFLIEAFARLAKNMPDVCLLLAGDGPLKQRMVDKVKQLGIWESVIFLGVRSDVPVLLQAFDAFVFPSLHEGLPVTLIEAQGAGLPCLISEEITEEVDIGLGLVRFLPLTEPDDWVTAMKGAVGGQSQRKMLPDLLAAKGYDIRNTAKDAQSAYLELGGEAGWSA